MLNESTGTASPRSELYCLDRCLSLGCALVSLSADNRQCQFAVLNDASTTAGPPGTHVRRLLGTEAGSRLWQAVDFGEQLRTKAVARVFTNSSTGRIGSVQNYTVQFTACYRIEAFGARGGSTNPTDPVGNVSLGGLGAKVSGKFMLTNGTVLAIVVGQRGGDAAGMYRVHPSHGWLEFSGSGGGGGSFVYRRLDNSLLLSAGGGGGATNTWRPGNPGQASRNGTDTIGQDAEHKGFGGVSGNPGMINTAGAMAYYKFGGAGAGWLGKCSVLPRTGDDADSGGSLADGWLGGRGGATNNAAAVGGFGGGGGGGEPCGGSGGGGGYSGGGAGRACAQTGGGGGSFCAGTGCNATTGGNTVSDQGLVVLQMLGPSCG